MIVNLVKRIRARNVTFSQRDLPFKPLRYMLSVAAGAFCWEKEGISDLELKHSIDEFVHLAETVKSDKSVPKTEGGSLTVSAKCYMKNGLQPENMTKDGWDFVVSKDNFQIWRKQIQNSSLYQYKVFGTFNDVPAKTFFHVQLDTEYRKRWDKLVIKLDIIDRYKNNANHFNANCNENTGNEVLHWVMKYPYPMYNREYVYVRRWKIDYKNNFMILISKSIQHPKMPETTEYVRVIEYRSQMVIKPHTTFDDCGFDYMLTYYDDPRASFTSRAYNWMAFYGVHDFVERVHNAALQLHHTFTQKIIQTPG